MTPLVSVCMTTYNHELYIAQAIESVMEQQTSFGVELVLGEDCSTDGTMALCREYAARYPDRIRLVSGSENVGMRGNYRRTIAACQGRYVAMCDGDDWWCNPHKLQMEVELLEANSDCGMCYTRGERFFQATGDREHYPKVVYTDFDQLLFNNTVENCTALARRELIERYYTEVCPEQHPEWLTDDACMWIWFAAKSRIEFIDTVTAVHRMLPQSVSQSGAYHKQIAFCDSLMDISLWFDKHYGTGRHSQRLRQKRSSVALWVLSHHGPMDEYLARWWQDIATTPHLLMCAAGYGLLVKKVLFRRKK